MSGRQTDTGADEPEAQEKERFHTGTGNQAKTRQVKQVITDRSKGHAHTDGTTMTNI